MAGNDESQTRAGRGSRATWAVCRLLILVGLGGAAHAQHRALDLTVPDPSGLLVEPGSSSPVLPEMPAEDEASTSGLKLGQGGAWLQPMLIPRDGELQHPSRGGGAADPGRSAWAERLDPGLRLHVPF